MSVFLYHAYAFGIMEQPSAPAPMLECNIQWAFPRRKHFNDRVPFDFHPMLNLHRYAALGVLGWRDLTPDLAGILQRGGLGEVVLGLLAQGEHVRLFVDYHQIKHSAFYLEGHFRHDFLVFDYRSDVREFQGAIFGKTGRFGLATVPFDRLHEAVVAPHARGGACAPYCRGNSLLALRAGSAPHLHGPLNSADIKTQLKGYLESSNLSQSSLTNPTVKRLCQTRVRAAAYGLAAYDHMCAYFSRAAAKTHVGCDLRVTRLLWEHKKLMQKRLRRLQGDGFPLDAGFLAAWDRIELLARGIHLKAFAARQRQDGRILASLVGDLGAIKGLEEDFLPRLINLL